MNQQASIESLEEISDQFAMSKFASSQDRFNAMVAHIVALREENERLQREVTEYRDCIQRFSDTSVSDERIIIGLRDEVDALESQLAEMGANSDLLRQGVEAITQRGTGGLIQPGDWRAVYPDKEKSAWVSCGDAENLVSIFGGQVEWRGDVE